MEFLIKKGDIMAEAEQEEFFEQLGKFTDPLIFVVEGPNIDIIVNDKEEYDYYDMVGTIFIDTKTEEILKNQRSELIQRLKTMGLSSGGSQDDPL